jgi:hypothetical protein
MASQWPMPLNRQLHQPVSAGKSDAVRICIRSVKVFLQVEIP